MMEYGEKVTADPSTFDDPQYMFLRERLKALKDGWEEVHQMWENRQTLLSQSLNLQMFNRDAKQAEVLLSQQEHLLSKAETPTNLEQAENLIKKHEALLTTMEANDDKVNGVLQFASRLCDEDHYAAEKIFKKAEELSERRNSNRGAALSQMDKLRDDHMLHSFLQDCDELNEWIQERNVAVQQDTYRQARTIHSKWTRHQAFASEIDSNEERLEKVQQSGQALLEAKPEMQEFVSPKLDELTSTFQKLKEETKEKGERLFDAKRADLYDQSVDDIDSFAKQTVSEMEEMPQEVEDLEEQAEHLIRMEPEKQEEIMIKKKIVQEQMEAIKAPIEKRKQELLKKKETYQLRRDVEDENLWIDEKMVEASNRNLGNSLQEVTLLQKKNKMVMGEIDNHAPRITAVADVAEKLISKGHPSSDEFAANLKDLKSKR